MRAQSIVDSPIDTFSSSPRRVGKAMWYWIPTAFVVLNALGSGAMDAIRLPAGMEVFHHLGYPDYFATLLGTAKILGGLALVVPLPERVREWAYAGLTYDVLAALVSIAATGDPASHLVIPAVFLALTLASYRAWQSQYPRAKAST